jgi:hypothetical protein
LSHIISLSAEEVESRFQRLGIPNRFDQLEKERFTTTSIILPDAPIFAFPTPAENAGLNIIRLRQICGTDPRRQPAFFDHPWYLDEAFAQEDCPGGWHCLHLNVLHDSISMPWGYIRSLSNQQLELPSAVEATLMLFLHFAGTGEQLLQKKHTWCSDGASMNRRVTVGAFGRNGLFVSGHQPDFASRGLGTCAKIKC